jgi:O-antigen/teichoic acid export membrane protein
LEEEELDKRRIVKGGRGVRWVFFDQALVSGVNFLTTVLLVRFLLPESYGEFVLAYSVLFFLKNIHLAMVTTPLMMVGPTYRGDGLVRFSEASFFSHVIFVVVATLLLLLILPLIQDLPTALVSRGLTGPLIFATVAVLSQEFVRKTLLAALSRRRALVNDIVSYGLQLSGLLVWEYRFGIDAPTSLNIIGMTSLTATIIGVRQCGLHWPKKPIDRTLIVRNWNFGKWLAGTYVALWLSDRWYLFATAAYLTIADTGGLGACVALLGVANMAYLAFENYVAPSLARELATVGTKALSEIFTRAYLFGVVGVGGMCGLAASYPREILVFMYGEPYEPYYATLRLLALQTFISLFTRLGALGLKILHETKLVFGCYLVAAIVTITMAIPLIQWKGLQGAAFGMVVTQIVLAVPMTIFFIRRSSKRG